MRKGIHPENYRLVAFKDMSNEDVFLTKSTANTNETLEVDGVEYPLAKVELSSRSHPFFTGQMKIVDTAGRVERFERRYGARRGKAPAAAAADAAPATAEAATAADDS